MYNFNTVLLVDML